MDKKRIILLLVICIMAINFTNVQAITQTFVLKNATCAGKGLLTDCTSLINVSDDISQTLQADSSNFGYVNATWNISLTGQIIDIIAIFEWQATSSGKIAEWYFLNSSLYNLIGCQNSTTLIGNQDQINTCNLTKLYPSQINLNNIVLQNKLYPSANFKIDYFALNITYNPDNIPPLINIVYPEDKTYGYNTSLSLNYSIYDASNLSSCWWNLDKGINRTIACGQNTTFNTSEGNHVLYFYANDSLGNFGNVSRSFSVSTTLAISLEKPINNLWLNYKNIEFNYTVNTASSIKNCSLFGNFDGVWRLNQTNSSFVNSSGGINKFLVNLSDGSYIWNVFCSNTYNSFALNNYTLNIDSVSPSLSLIEPTGTKTSRTEIPLSFSVSDNNLQSCWYNVYRGVNIEIQNTTINCSAQTSFDVTLDADFVLNLYVNDSAGNQNSASSSFKIDTSTPSNPPVTDSGGGGGGGGGGSGNTTVRGKLEISGIDNLVARSGDKKTLSLNVKNTGKIFLNNCKIIPKGQISSWIYSNQIQGIAPGENVNFVFNLNVPEETRGGDYSVEIELGCNEAGSSQGITVTIPKAPESIIINDITYKNSQLNIKYNFDSLNSSTKEVEVEIWLVDEDGNEIKRMKDNFNVDKPIVERNILMEVPDDLAGVYSIYFALSSNLDNFVKQSVVLGKSSATGLTILDKPRNKMIAYIIFILIVVIGVFFAVWESKRPKVIERKKIYKVNY